jgi:hypothetical protein
MKKFCFFFIVFTNIAFAENALALGKSLPQERFIDIKLLQDVLLL